MPLRCDLTYCCRIDSTCLPRAVGVQDITTQVQRGVLVEAIGVTVLELHEIWQVEGKQRSDPDSMNVAKI